MSYLVPFADFTIENNDSASFAMLFLLTPLLFSPNHQPRHRQVVKYNSADLGLGYYHNVDFSIVISHINSNTIPVCAEILLNIDTFDVSEWIILLYLLQMCFLYTLFRFCAQFFRIKRYRNKGFVLIPLIVICNALQLFDGKPAIYICFLQRLKLPVATAASGKYARRQNNGKTYNKDSFYLSLYAFFSR